MSSVPSEISVSPVDSLPSVVEALVSVLSISLTEGSVASPSTSVSSSSIASSAPSISALITFPSVLASRAKARESSVVSDDSSLLIISLAGSALSEISSNPSLVVDSKASISPVVSAPLVEFPSTSLAHRPLKFLVVLTYSSSLDEESPPLNIEVSSFAPAAS